MKTKLAKRIIKEYRGISKTAWRDMPLTEKSKKTIRKAYKIIGEGWCRPILPNEIPDIIKDYQE